MMKAAATKKYRRISKEITEAAQVDSGPWEMATVAVTFYYNMQRRRDEDNAMGMLKAAYDGLVDAGLLVDDDYKHLRRGIPELQIDKEQPRVELLVTRVDPNSS